MSRTSRTAPDHDLVRRYLSDLDAALRGLPGAQARELKEQITAHLEDAVPPGTDDEQIAAILDRLGPPAELAAALRPPDASPRAALAMTMAWLRGRLARVRRRTWSVLVMYTVPSAIAAGYLIYYLVPGSLQLGDTSGWWYPKDYLHQVWTTADGAEQTMVPIRSGQRQGYFVAIYNPTDVTQTILGGVDGLDSPAAHTVQIGVSVPNRNINRGGATRDIRFTLPGAVPPHQYREVRVLWTSSVCLSKGSGEGIDQFSLRVRVGWFTRTEVISLGQGWYVSGPSQGPCI